MSSSAAKDLAGDADTADAKIDYDAAKVEFLQVQISVFRDSPSYSALCVSRCTSWLPDADCRVSGCVSVFHVKSDGCRDQTPFSSYYLE